MWDIMIPWYILGIGNNTSAITSLSLGVVGMMSSQRLEEQQDPRGDIYSMATDTNQ
jgi:hypothetical protein